MITKQEVEKIIKLNGEGFLKAFLCDLADYHIEKQKLKILEILESGSPKYNALKKDCAYLEDFFFIGNGDKPIINEEEGKLLKGIGKASDELIEEYKEEVEKILKDMN